ncbi:MAG TPA: potassium-transporting ATPase subunit KdpA, partial [Acidimicrobiales bacterium]
MTAASWLQFVALVVALGVSVPLVGRYLARVFDGGSAPGDRFFGPVERLAYRLTGVDPEREQRWPTYATSLLAFSAVSVLALYALQRFQGSLPFNPTGVDGVPPALAFNTAVSFVTNTNWQNYAGENTMSHLTQMVGLAVQNFVSAAVGLAVAIAFIRGLVRRRFDTIGNFWVDLVRGTVRVLLPIAFLAAIVLVSQGVVQNLGGFEHVTTVEGAAQVIPGGPQASQEAIKELGTNGGGFLNANSAHPFANPNGFTDLFEIYLLLLIPFSLTVTFGRMAGDRRQGHAVLAAMLALWLAAAGLAMAFEVNGNPELDARGVTQTADDGQAGGNLEGKEVRFGPAASGLFAASTTGTSTGAVNSAHDSFTPGGGAVPLVNIMLGEVSPGGVGAGLYGMLIFAVLAVFIAGLMVGRTPEYLGKKIQAAEMKLVVAYILVVPVLVLAFTGISVVMDSSQSSILNAGPHGLTEVTYAFTSAANNNGSAFAGLSVNTDWYNTALGLAMVFGRFLPLILV